MSRGSCKSIGIDQENLLPVNTVKKNSLNMFAISRSLQAEQESKNMTGGRELAFVVVFM